MLISILMLDRIVLKLGVIGFVALLGSSQNNLVVAQKSNIVFILSDDHSVPFLGSYGNKDMNTPNLDKLAAEGMRYNRAYTTSPQCVLSRASIMTGRSTLDIGMTRFSAALPREIITYPELLRDAGYFTGICGRSYHLDGGKNPEEEEEVFKEFNLRTFADRVDYLNVAWNGESINKQFVEFIDSVPDNKPFFIQVGYSDPHRDFTAPEFEPDPDTIMVPPSMPDTKLIRKDLAAHIGEINRCDYYIGLILEELDKRDLTDNTLVVFMGDNGAALLRGKGTLFEYGLNVPLLAWWPKCIKPGQVSDALISGEDIALTFLEVAGVSKGEAMTGKSFAPSFSESEYKGHDFVFAVRGAHGKVLPYNSSHFDLGRVIIGERYKLIYNAMWQLPYVPVDFYDDSFWMELKKLNANNMLEKKFSNAFFQKNRPMFEVYDLLTDPFEFNNLAGEPEFFTVEQNLKKELLRWMITNQDYLPLPISPHE